jgi:hypothetical protein
LAREALVAACLGAMVVALVVLEQALGRAAGE